MNWAASFWAAAPLDESPFTVRTRDGHSRSHTGRLVCHPPRRPAPTEGALGAAAEGTEAYEEGGGVGQAWGGELVEISVVTVQ